MSQQPAMIIIPALQILVIQVRDAKTKLNAMDHVISDATIKPAFALRKIAEDAGFVKMESAETAIPTNVKLAIKRREHVNQHVMNKHYARHVVAGNVWKNLKKMHARPAITGNGHPNAKIAKNVETEPVNPNADNAKPVLMVRAKMVATIITNALRILVLLAHVHILINVKTMAMLVQKHAMKITDNVMFQNAKMMVIYAQLHVIRGNVMLKRNVKIIAKHVIAIMEYAKLKYHVPILNAKLVLVAHRDHASMKIYARILVSLAMELGIVAKRIAAATIL
jgi:hypothetical protein